MSDSYYIDLTQFSLERLKHSLTTYMTIPSYRILLEDIDARFEHLQSMGIDNLQVLIDTLKTKPRVASFAAESGLPHDYVVVLRRAAGNYLPKPRKLSDFPEVDPATIEKLAAAGIKHTKHLFERAKTKQERSELSQLTGVSEDDLLELVKLSDLARIVGVGPRFARLFYETGLDTLEKLITASPEDLYERLIAVNQERNYTKTMASLKDVALCNQMAKDLPKVIEF